MRFHLFLCLLVALFSIAQAQSSSDQTSMFAEFRKAYGEISALEPALSFEQKTIKARALAEERLAKAG
ncbi:hypothetical protein PRIPAC_78988 [Pristionchus pacificus]|uniref:Uncharacterized protein n=1 Tax=Pristionchus pacificus TaxID=54126 RepID=A0A2A6BW51_PRIPA|nr:hypothetical protein PRIPAC_78988 [Pristionchus pacificus]|eukprot:PDM70056.1 hypothetical protein PRIPAC_49268 [Pristionchus pacificus]